MRALKVLVVVMGVLLILGTAVLAVTIVTRLAQRQIAATPPNPGLAERPHPFGRTSVSLPPSAKIVGMAGAGSRLVLRLERADGKQELLVLDPDTAEVVGTIELSAGD